MVRAPHHHQSSPPATDLGYLLHKNPARLESFELSFGHAHVFYPEAACDRCTVALLLDVDPVGLVRNRRGPSGEGGALDQYVNERNFPGTQRFSLYCFGRIDYSLAQSLSFCSDRLSALL
ncbi:MAG TPA: hypothetical protein VN669_16295 [Candidatus Acidoferrales bacterium]|nr:hypothetical protein [Candidatus Acidoferrales bacterium]